MSKKFSVAAVASIPLTLMMPVSPATAVEECKTQEHDTGLVTRTCYIESSRIGGFVNLDASWDYPQGSARGRKGYVAFKIKDRTDGNCAIVKVKYRDHSKNPNSPETVRRKACGGSTSKVYGFDLNAGDAAGIPFPVYEKGVYSVEHCTGSKDCITLWRQNVAEKAPS